MIAEVIVDISTAEVDRVFDYRLPDTLKVGLGQRVLAPFGRMTVEGFIIALKETSEIPDKLKDIIEPLDDYAVVSTELLGLLDFMTAQYHLRKVDVLRLFIPAEMRRGRIKELNKRFAALKAEYRGQDPSGFIKKSAVAQNELFAYLNQVQSAGVAELNRNFSAAALKNLEARGIVELFETAVARTPYRDETGTREKEVVLTEAQSRVAKAVAAATDGVFLLHGVTGSGKTEVYMHCISEVLRQGKTAVMLVPEISLTPQVLRVFRGRFGQKVALLHSGLSAGERFDEWRRLLSGEAVVAVGARSAVFAPVQNLGLLIIDEEHDHSYISESNPRYHTIEVAKRRARLSGCPLLLGSATPSIESYYAAKQREYTLLELPERINRRPLPDITIVNMCKEVYEGNDGIFSRAMRAALTDCMGKGDQAIVFINRRGYASFMLCPECGYVAKCADCDVSLVYHKEDHTLKCHYCGNRYPVLTACPSCRSERIRRGFVGTEQVAEALKAMFPGKKVLRMDNDTTRTKDAHATILKAFSSGEAAILVGTQMIAKGHDFPDVTLVGIVDADLSLHFADFRSFERTFQLITQVSGRAGRDKKPGSVVLQTYSPNHYVYRFAVTGDYRGFFDKECNLREVTKYPPFSRIIRVLVTSSDEALAGRVLKGIFEELTQGLANERRALAYFAAMKSPVKRIKGAHRVQILLRLTRDFDKLTALVYNTVDRHAVKNAACFVEINPNSLY
ncbi:MAG: primosomal protein N' [Clostridiales bacterium]|jgi:primosomal protein N' (replication factor Y)|nr:primosomal protein N' [Clostridiales bacterium]